MPGAEFRHGKHMVGVFAVPSHRVAMGDSLFENYTVVEPVMRVIGAEDGGSDGKTGHGAVAFEAVDAAFDGVALGVDLGVERGWSTTRSSFVLAVTELVDRLWDGGCVLAGGCGWRGTRKPGQPTPGPGVRCRPPRCGAPGFPRSRW
ncbi:hypothetical protein JCM33774_57540 [Actinophytocola sp. KF-1]